MRNLSATALTQIAQTTAGQPLIVVGIDWVEGSGTFYYADRRVGNSPVLGGITNLGGLDEVLDISNASSSASIQLTISDVDGVIKDIFNYNDVHSRPVTIYQWFADLSFNDKFILFQGAISGPISWSEGARTLSFDVATKLDDREVGFTVEEGDFTNVPEILIGKAWPLVFGTVVNAPVVQMDEIPTGTLRVSYGISDSSLEDQLAYIEQQSANLIAKAACLETRAAELIRLAAWLGLSAGPDDTGIESFDDALNQINDLFDNSFGSEELVDGNALRSQMQSMLDQAAQLKRQSFDLIRQSSIENFCRKQRLQLIYEHQSQYQRASISVINGKNFLQNTSLEILVNDIRMTGSFQGDNFIITKSWYNERDKTTAYQGTDAEAKGLCAQSVFTDPYSAQQEKDRSAANCESPGFVLPYPNTDVAKQDDFHFVNAGASVRPGANYPVRYILTIVPNVTVISLSAERTINNLRTVTTIPSSYYSISTLDYGTVTATIATFNPPLGSREGEDWGDTIYATMQSSIGPNTVDILQWIIENYTDYVVDTTSFAAVHTKIENYPSNFALLDTENVTELLKNIAFQARLGISLKNGVFYLQYLPEEGTPVATIDHDGVIASSMSIESSDSEAIVTKIVAEWKNDYAKSENNKVIARYNVSKYGLREQSYDFFIYDDVNLVEKAVRFWIIRKGNIWKKLNCDVPLDMLAVETLDSVTLSSSHLANANVTGIVESAILDSDNLIIRMAIWSPVRLGEMTEYDFAYPADIAVTLLFPTDDDIAGQFAQEAQGNIGGQYNATIRSGAGNSARQFAPSDQADSINNLPPPVTSRDDKDSGYMVTTADTAPVYDYSYARVSVPETNINPSIPEQSVTQEMRLGFIGEQNGDNGTYGGVIYLQGLEKVKKKTVTGVLVPPGQDITPLTWGYFLVITKVKNGEVIVEYNFTPSGAGNAYAASVVSGTDDTYTVAKIMADGSTENVTATQMLIKSGTTIPAGTPAILVKTGDTYRMQVPIWAGSA